MLLNGCTCRISLYCFLTVGIVVIYNISIYPLLIFSQISGVKTNFVPQRGCLMLGIWVNLNTK